MGHVARRSSTSNPTGGISEAKAKYIEKMTGLTKTPREQLNEFKKRNKPAVILKMKPVNALSSREGSASNQPNIINRPIAVA